MHRYGKRRRTVPVLIDRQVESALQAIHMFSQQHGHDNMYVFNRPGITDFVRGVDALREVVVNCSRVVQLHQPQLLRSTNLRKHIASTCQIISLREEELEWLANHLGHDIATHKNYYRLPQNCIELAKISKLLYLSTSGNVKNLKGCSLDSIVAEGM